MVDVQGKGLGLHGCILLGARGSGKVQFKLRGGSEFGGPGGVGQGGQSRNRVGYALSTSARPLDKSGCRQEARWATLIVSVSGHTVGGCHLKRRHHCCPIST